MDFRELADRLGGKLEFLEVGEDRIPDRFVVTHAGLPDVEVAAQYSSGTFTRATFRAPVGRLLDVPEIELSPETDVERDGKRRGVNREVQVDDVEFDDAVYITTDAGDALVRRLLAPPEVRRLVLRFVEEHRTLTIAAGVCWELEGERLDDATAERVRALAELAAKLPDVRDLVGDRRGPRQPRISYAAHVVLGVVFFAAMIAVDPPQPIFGRHTLLCFLASLPLWAVYSGIVFVDRRGRPRSSMEISAILGASFLAFIVPGGALLAWANAALDRSAPHVERVAARYVGFDDEDDEHEIEVRGFLGADEMRLEFDEDELAVDPKTLRTLRLTVRDGYFGWPYLVGAAVE